MKSKNKLLSLLLVGCLLFLTSCSIKKDDLDGATIYTTDYPINYITNYLYGSYSTISSIYPKDIDLNEYTLTDKQISEYAKGDLFIYNGLSSEKDIAKTLINKNSNLLIIDVSYGLSINNDVTELWLSPSNYLMIAKNVKDNLQSYLTSKYIIEDIDAKYNTFEEKISLIDASLHTIGKDAQNNGNNTIIVSNNSFKYLENYGFNIISLSDSSNLKENKLKNIRNNFKSSKYKYILVMDTDKDNETINDLINNYGAKAIYIDSLTTSLNEDYFDLMNEYIENIKLCIN